VKKLFSYCELFYDAASRMHSAECKDDMNVEEF
jgi:hypothetical protein